MVWQHLISFRTQKLSRPTFHVVLFFEREPWLAVRLYILNMKKENPKEIALKRVKQLFKEADSVFNKDPKLAKRYVNLARKIAMKVRLRMPKELKRKFCKHCYSYLMPGVNLRVRTQRGKVVYYCLKCKKYMRFPYVREQKAKRKKSKIL